MTERGTIKIMTDVPGPRSRQLYSEMEQSVPKGVGHQTPIAISSARGATITDVDGNTYIDFAGGIGTLNIGHCPEQVVKAIKEQADNYLHACFHIVIYEPYIRLANKLNAIAPGQSPKKTILVNSGAEAVENAIKIARYYTKRYVVLSFLGGFHGRTDLTMSLTGQIKPYKYNFGPPAPWVYHLPFAYCYRCPFGQTYPSCEIACAKYVERVFESVVSPDAIAALIVEPVQGEGGFIVPPKEFLPEIYRICKEQGIIFIADEVQAGMARTGKMFAIEHSSIEPDMITMAKTLGGGTVLGAVIGKAEIMDAVHPGGLGTTFGGHPLSCQASLAAFDLIEKNNLVARANTIGSKVKQAFYAMQEKYSLIGDVRGLGAMVAIELVKDRTTKEPAPQETALIRKKCYENGLITVGAGIHHNVIRILVPLVITDEELEEGLSILEKSFKSIL
ncbi:MAG TPA: 4-aminobutyrate--2-oxoglutarate transaminase [Dehalococcoidia bacterium]|nr:4-aminobutyrate--2-oxoglutarate transaminase [Dehalococcoidia bacterium]